MKIANLIIGLISSLHMLCYDGLVFIVAILYSLNSLLDTTGKYTAGMDSTTTVIVISALIFVIGIVSLIMCIVGFVKSRKPDATTGKYTVTYGIVCGITVVANVLAFFFISWLDAAIGDSKSILSLPVAGLVFAFIMILLTVLNAIKYKDA